MSAFDHTFLPPSDPNEYISMDAWRRSVRAQYVSERKNQTLCDSRQTPSQIALPMIGTWAIESFKGIHGHEVSHLLMLDPASLLVSEYEVQFNYGGRRWNAELYAEWLQKGLTPPPIEVVQLADGTGRLKVNDGHRRTHAAILAKRPVAAWVSPCMPHPKSLIDTSTGKVMLTGMTFEEMTGQPWPQASVGRHFDALLSNVALQLGLFQHAN